MSSVAVSVIVPVFNAEKYLRETVESIVGQTLSKIEIILVNDGSIDGSLALCQAFAEQDSRIKVINKSNGGVSSARNCGIQHASGDYIMFVDSDDMLIQDALEKLLNTAVNTKADIVFCNYCVKIIGKNNVKVIPKNHGQGNYEIRDQKDIINLAQKIAFNKACFAGASSSWAKLWRREFLVENRIFFDVGRNHGEDWYFVMDALCRAKKVSFMEGFLYIYTFYKVLKKDFLRNAVIQRTFYEMLEVFDKFEKRFPEFNYESIDYFEFCYRGFVNVQIEILESDKLKKEKQTLLKEIYENKKFLFVLSKLNLTVKQNNKIIHKEIRKKKIKTFIKKAKRGFR